MAHINATSVKNGSRTENRNGQGNNDLSEFQKAIVKSTQELFPTWINNSIFNTIYAFGILANIILLAYLVYYKRYKTPVFCVILSLGVADLCGCVGCLILYTMVTPFIIGPLWLCQLTVLLTRLAYLVSSYHIAFFAVLRFLQLVYPLASHSKVTTGLMFKICLVIWGAHTVQAIASTYYREVLSIGTVDGNIIYGCFFTGDKHFFILWVIVTWCVVPFLLTGGFHVAKQLVVMVSRSVTSEDERVQQLRRQTDSRALALVIVMYLISIAPYTVQAFRIYVLNITQNPIQVYLVEVFDQLAYSNSAINPWIYLFAAESVRSDIKNMLSCNKVIRNKTENNN